MTEQIESVGAWPRTDAASDEAAIAGLVRLVEIRSHSGEEREASLAFVRIAQSLGFQCEIDEAGNAIARRGEVGEGPHVVMLGHIDTVAGEIPVRVEDGVLHGRGSVDAKGPLMAHLFAGARAELAPGACVEVIAAVGEEAAGSPGARYLMHQRRPDACFIGEPSHWEGVTLGYKGRLLIEATCEREVAHTASKEETPSDTVVRFWQRFGERCRELEPGTSPFECVQTTIREMSSGDDGIMARARLEGGMRLPVGVTPGAIERVGQEVAAEVGVEVAFDGPEVAHRSERSDAVGRALSVGIRALGGRPQPKVKTGTSDMNVVAPLWECPIAAYGPGDSSLDHTPWERLELEEYLRAIGVLRVAVESLVGELCGSDEDVHHGDTERGTREG